MNVDGNIKTSQKVKKVKYIKVPETTKILNDTSDQLN